MALLTGNGGSLLDLPHDGDIHTQCLLALSDGWGCGHCFSPHGLGAHDGGGRLIGNAFGDRDNVAELHATGGRIDFGLAAGIGDGLVARLVEQLRGLRHHEVDAADLVGAGGDQRIDHIGDLADVAHPDSHPIAGAVAGITVALSLSTTPPIVAVPLSILAGFVAGALYGGLAGWLKAFFNVNEILSTIMLNAIAVQMMNYLLNGPLLDPTEVGVNHVPKTARIAEQLQIARLSIPLPEGVAELFSLQNAELFARTRLHWGLILAIVLAVLAYLLLWRTTIGYRIRAVGENERAAKYAGIRVRWNMVLAMMFAGGFAGLAGVVQVLGLQYRLQTDGSAMGFTANAGFNGIVVALFGGLNPLGAIPASIFFGGLLVGAQKMQRDLGVPAALITSINGMIVIFAVSSEYFRAMIARRRALGGGSMPGTQAVESRPKLPENPPDVIGQATL